MSKKEEGTTEENTEANGTPKLSQSEQLRKYKGGYESYQVANGSLSMDNGDELALTLRGSSTETVMRAAEKLKTQPDAASAIRQLLSEHRAIDEQVDQLTDADLQSVLEDAEALGLDWLLEGEE